MKYIPEKLRTRVMSAEDAAALIGENMCVGFSGFTLVGNPRVIPIAIAKLGKAKNMSVLTGASVDDSLDGALARAGLMKYRTPYQSNKSVRAGVNAVGSTVVPALRRSAAMQPPPFVSKVSVQEAEPEPPEDGCGTRRMV